MDRNLLALDVETTGLSFEKDEIIELSFQKGGEETVITWRFKPTVSVTPGAYKTHGISAEDLRDEPSFSEKAGDVKQVLDWAHVLIGYNVTYDIRFLEEAFKRLGKPMDTTDKLLIDPLRIWQAKEPRSLSVAVERFLGEDHEEAHSASGDVIATTRVLDQMIEDFDLTGLSMAELSDLCFPDRKSWIGPTNHLRWEAGQVVFGFGKYRGTAVLDVAANWSDYFDWMRRNNFPRHVMNIVKGAQQNLGEEEFNRKIEAAFGKAPEE